MISEKDKDITTRSYQIVVAGEIDHARQVWFASIGLAARPFRSDGDSFTLLSGPVTDQAHLRGILNKLWDLNFEVVRVRREEI